MEELLFENTIEEGDSIGVNEEEVVQEVVEQLLTVSENEVSENEIVGDQSSIFVYGGDDIVNYYNTYISVSGNTTLSENETMSENIITKPLNDYTVQEQLSVYGLLMFIGIGFYLIIRRSVFKWQ